MLGALVVAALAAKMPRLDEPGQGYELRGAAPVGGEHAIPADTLGPFAGGIGLPGGLALAAISSTPPEDVRFATNQLLQRIKERATGAGLPESALEQKQLKATMPCKTDCKQNKRIVKNMKKVTAVLKNWTAWKKVFDPYYEKEENHDILMQKIQQNLSFADADRSEGWKTLKDRDIMGGLITPGHKSTARYYKMQMKEIDRNFKGVASILAYTVKKSKYMARKMDKEKAKLSKELDAATLNNRDQLVAVTKGIKEANVKALKGIKEIVKMTKDRITKNIVVDGINNLGKKIIWWTEDANGKIKDSKDYFRLVGADLTKTMLRYDDELLAYGQEMADVRDYTDAYKEKHAVNLNKMMQESVAERAALLSKLRIQMANLKVASDQFLASAGSSHLTATANLEQWASDWLISTQSGMMQNQKELLDFLEKSGLSLESLKSILSGWIDTSGAAFEEIDAANQASRAKMESTYDGVQTQYFDESNDYSKTVQGDFSELRKVEGEEAAEQQLATISLAPAIQLEVKEHTQQADFGIGKLASQLKMFEVDEADLYDMSNAWAEKLNDAADFFGVSMVGMGNENSAQVSALASEIFGDFDATQQQYDGYGGNLVGNMVALQGEIGASTAALKARASKDKKAALDMFGRSLSSFHSKTDGTSAVVGADVNSMGEVVSATYQQLGAQTQKLAEQAGGLQSFGEALYAGLQNTAENMDLNAKTKGAAERQTESAMAKQLRVATTAAEKEATHDLAEVADTTTKKVKEFNMMAVAELEGKKGELTVLEKAMMKGMNNIENGAHLDEEAERQIREAAQRVNADVAAKFGAAKSALGADKLDLIKSMEAMQVELEVRKGALDTLQSTQISLMGSAQQQAFQQARSLRDQEIAEIMKNKNLEFDDRKAMILAAEKKMKDEMELIHNQAAVSNEELAAVAKMQREAADNVRSSMSMAHETISAQSLLLHDNEDDFKKALKERQEMAKTMLGELTGKMSAKMEAEIARVQADATKKITDIRNNDELSAEQKQKQIEMIDHFTREHMAGIAQEQVAADQGLGAFEASENAEEGGLAVNMKNLEMAIANAQNAASAESIKDRTMIKEQTDKVHSMADALLETIRQKDSMSSSEVEELHAQQQMALKEAELKIAQQAGDETAAAQAAEELATLVVGRANRGGQMTDQQLSALTERLDLLEGYSIQSVTTLRDELRGEEEDSDKAVMGSKNFLTSKAGTIIHQLEAVSNVLGSVADGSLNKQKQIKSEISHVTSIVSVMIADAQKIFATGVGDVEAKDASIAATVGKVAEWGPAYGPDIAMAERETESAMTGIGHQADVGTQANSEERKSIALLAAKESQFAMHEFGRVGNAGASQEAKVNTELLSNEEWVAWEQGYATKQLEQQERSVEKLGESLQPRVLNLQNGSNSMTDYVYSFQQKVHDQESKIRSLERDLAQVTAKSESHLELATAGLVNHKAAEASPPESFAYRNTTRRARMDSLTDSLVEEQALGPEWDFLSQDLNSELDELEEE